MGFLYQICHGLITGVYVTGGIQQWLFFDVAQKFALEITSFVVRFHIAYLTMICPVFMLRSSVPIAA